jgi:hypothetical protein
MSFRLFIRASSSGHHQMGHRNIEPAHGRTTECTPIYRKEPGGDSCRLRLTRILHRCPAPAPSSPVLTHRRPSDGLCRPRWRRCSVSMKQATASLARVGFVMSDRRPSGHRTRHIPGPLASGSILAMTRAPSLSFRLCRNGRRGPTGAFIARQSGTYRRAIRGCDRRDSQCDELRAVLWRDDLRPFWIAPTSREKYSGGRASLCQQSPGCRDRDLVSVRATF